MSKTEVPHGALDLMILRVLSTLGPLHGYVRQYLDMFAEENQTRGLPPAEARRQAMLAFGGVEATKEVFREAARKRDASHA